MLPCGSGIEPFGGARDRTPVVELEQLHLDERLGEPLCEAVIVERAAFDGHAPQLVDELRVHDELAGVHAAFVRERGVGDPPTFVHRADEAVVGDEHVGEEHLVELRLVGDLAQRAHVDTGRVHVDDERRDPLLLRRIGIGAREAPAPVGELRVARPHLLAVEHPTAVDLLGACAQRREITAGFGLAEELAPDLGRVEDVREPTGLLRFGAVREQRRPDQVDADAPDELGARARASSSVTR